MPNVRITIEMVPSIALNAPPQLRWEVEGLTNAEDILHLLTSVELAILSQVIQQRNAAQMQQALQQMPAHIQRGN